MCIELGHRDKIDVLLKVLELNAAHVEWIKNMDYKVTYYTLVFVIAVVVWIAASPVQLPPLFVIVSSLIGVCGLAILLLAKNHWRHKELNEEFRRIVHALKLNQANSYSTQQIVTLRQSDLPFHLGRSLYMALIIVSGLLAGLFAVQVPQVADLAYAIDRSRALAARAFLKPLPEKIGNNFYHYLFFLRIAFRDQ